MELKNLGAHKRRSSPMLFIGGPADGRRIDVPDNRDWWEIVKRSCPMPTVWPLNDEEPLAPDVTCETTTYLKRPFHGNSHEFFVMAAENLTPDDIISNLIQGYKGV